MITQDDIPKIEEMLVRGLPNALLVDASEDNALILRLSLFSEDCEKDIGSFKFLFNNDSIDILAAYIYFSNRYQGVGYGKAVLRNLGEVSDHYGITTISVSAALERGGYAWAKYGFVPNQDDWNWLRGGTSEKLTRKLSAVNLDEVNHLRKLRKLPEISEKEFLAAKQVVKSALSNPDPKAIWLVADSVIGNALLSGISWSGDLHLYDPQERTRFESYIAQGRDVSCAPTRESLGL